MDTSESPNPERILSLLRGRLLDRDHTIRDRGLAAGLRRLLLDHPLQYAQGLIALGRAGLGDCATSTADRAVIGLFALHPLEKHNKDFNFGSSCRALSQRGSEGEDPFEKHFRRLLACRTGADAAAHVARITRRLKNDNVPVNYCVLLGDLRLWSDQVREKWVRSYFTTESKNDSTGSAASGPPPATAAP